MDKGNGILIREQKANVNILNIAGVQVTVLGWRSGKEELKRWGFKPSIIKGISILSKVA